MFRDFSTCLLTEVIPVNHSKTCAIPLWPLSEDSHAPKLCQQNDFWKKQFESPKQCSLPHMPTNAAITFLLSCMVPPLKFVPPLRTYQQHNLLFTNWTHTPLPGTPSILLIPQLKQISQKSTIISIRLFSLTMAPLKTDSKGITGCIHHQGKSGWRVKLTTHLHLVLRSKICGAIPPLPNMPSRHGGQLICTGTT
jgi:hypothetical protein